ncbi:hypothetical protein CVU37_09450 [candidate division BRC1 bacterium HGW-BRC1-1]|nr:MAG: hypothetical protein CVU37_09450 [candidate division BRC1 bacterium HGW-BRC1-1]
MTPFRASISIGVFAAINIFTLYLYRFVYPDFMMNLPNPFVVVWGVVFILYALSLYLCRFAPRIMCWVANAFFVFVILFHNLAVALPYLMRSSEYPM